MTSKSPMLRIRDVRDAYRLIGEFPDTLWYRCASFTDYRRPAHVDHQLTSVRQVPNGAISVICVHRGLGERNFSDRERRLLDFFHAELGMLIGRSIVSATEQAPDAFAPRLRQTLACLLQGDSEKQVASRLRPAGCGLVIG
jgi:hypothetical protein